MNGLSSNGCFARRLPIGLRIAPCWPLLWRQPHKRVMVDHEGFNGRYSDCRVTNIIHHRTTTKGRPPMSLWMHWWNAIWRLRPAFSRLQTFLWFATAVAVLRRAYGMAWA